MENAMSQPRANRYSVRYLVQLSVLVAILLVLEFTGWGIIRTPGLEFTILQVPVIIGAIIMGPVAGGILGCTFGLISFWECFGKSAFGAGLLAINPFYTFVVCVIARTLMGLLCGVIFQALKRLDRSSGQLFAFAGASLLGALLNTTFFMGALILFFYQTPYIQNFAQMLGSSNPFLFILGFVGFQGLLEALLCTFIGATVARALYHSLKLK